MDASVEPEAFEGTDRFRIQRRLGAGSYGTVYEAFDRERGVTVALKVLRQDDPAALYRFKKEFRALADVTHPNLVELYELMSHGSRWFFTMELVDGAPFLSRAGVAAAPSIKGSTVVFPPAASSEAVTAERVIPPPAPRSGPARDWDELRSLLRQLAEGLSALHAAGHVHRDIKPHNVMVTREGRVVILDFGLVMELAAPELERSSGRHAVGTPAYMSPEQSKGLPVTEASDWYSVGVMLYEALTGVRPFAGGTVELLVQKQHDDAVPPGQRAPGIPEDLDLLCCDLLKRDERDRPTGAEVLRRLKGDARPQAGSTSGSRSGAAPFIGRREQLAALHRAFAKTKEGNVATVLVRGRSGVGKSTLVWRFLAELARRDPTCIILHGRCYERESMPYKALDSLIDALTQYLRSLPPQEADALLPRDVLMLARLFPVLKRVEAVSRARRRALEVPDSQELRRRAVAALRELFARLADRVSLVLFIDDLQWGDADSAALLSSVLRPPDAPPLLLVGCRRPEDGVSAEDVFHLDQVTPLEDDPLATPEEIFLDQLSPDEAEELARGLLGSGRRAAEAAHTIALESRGNPFFLYELVHAARTEDGPGLPEGAPTLDALIGTRVAGLPDPARRLLEVVAVAGEPVERSVALRAAEAESRGAEAIALLQSGRLIRAHRLKGRDALETTHDRVRETVVRLVSPETAKDHHRRLAHALEAWGQADPEALAVHFQAAEELETAAEYVVEAAQNASGALAFDRAARLYVVALNLGAGEAEARALRVSLGDALANAGRGAESAEAYMAAARGASAATNLELRRRAAEQLLRSGHVDQGLAAIRDVLGAVGMRLPQGPRRALLSLLYRRALIKLRGLSFRERDASQVAAERLMRIDICWSVAAGLGIVDPIRGYDFQARQLLFALRAGEPYRVARALSLEVAYNATGGGPSRRRTERISHLTASLAKRLDHPHTLGLSSFVAGLAAYLEGRWRTAQELCDRAEEILRDRCTGVAWELGNARFYALRSLVCMGRFAELSGRLPTYLKDARSRGDLYEETNLRARVACAVLLVLDKPEKARQEIREPLARWSQRGFYVQHYYDLFGQTEIDLYEGDAAAAWRRVVAGWPGYRRSLLPRIQMVFLESCHLHARAVLAAVAAGTLPASEAKVAERDARTIERAGMPWCLPFAQLICATVAALSNDTRRAAELLAAAEAGFESTDALLYAAAARARRGQLLGGPDGEKLVADAEEWMKGQRVGNPGRLLGCLTPGRWRA